MRPDIEEYLREQGWVFAGVSQPDHKRQWAQMDGDKVKRVALESELEDLALEIIGSPSGLDEAAKEYVRNYIPFDQCDSRDIIRTFKAGWWDRGRLKAQSKKEMTRGKIRFQVAVSCIQGILEAKLGIIGEVAPEVAVKESLRIADEFVRQWFGDTKN